METETQAGRVGSSINYYVIGIIAFTLLVYTVGNALEPDVDSELDFFEVTLVMGFAAAAIFAFITTKRYWGSKVFGRAYLALALGYTSYCVGWVLWFVYEISYQVENPYPYYPDIGYFGFFPFALYHLRTNIAYFKRKLDTRQKLVLISIPVCASLGYLILGIVPLDSSGGIFKLEIQSMPAYDFEFYKELVTGFAFVFVTSLVFSYAIIGTQIFRNTVLGSAWGLLLGGFSLNAFADIPYYYFELFGVFERAMPMTGLWMASTMIVCYALYKHRAL